MFYHKNYYKILLILIILFSFVLPVLAGNLSDAFKSTGPLSTIAGPQGAGYNTTESATIENIVGKIIKTFLAILGILFICLALYGGYLWMTARGKSEQVEKAQTLLTDAVIGLIIIVGAYVITYFVLSSITQDYIIEHGF